MLCEFHKTFGQAFRAPLTVVDTRLMAVHLSAALEILETDCEGDNDMLSCDVEVQREKISYRTQLMSVALNSQRLHTNSNNIHVANFHKRWTPF